jgi:NarL family two-component system sensor histidine kinase YdfH
MQRKGQFVGLPFYIFISLLLGILAVSGARAVLRSASLPVVFVYVLLFGVHVGLYWFNMKHYQNRRWIVFYCGIQTILMIALVNFPYGGDGVRFSILGSIALSMIGEALGLWGNTWRSLVMGLFYAGLLLVQLFFMVDRNVYGSVVSGLLINGTLVVLFMIVLNQQFAEREKAEELAESLESANARLAASAAKIESLTLQNERQRMARELHDTLAQGLAGLILQLEAVKAHLATDRAGRASAIVDQALVRARSTLAESRAAIDDLRAAPADLAESVREKVDRFTRATGIPCELDMSLQENELSTEVIVHTLSILSESLVNVTRHAQATHVDVRFTAGKNGLELEVRDDGGGFDVNQETGAGHYGLLGMRERARLTGGALIVESDAERGTKVRFVLGSAGGTR